MVSAIAIFFASMARVQHGNGRLHSKPPLMPSNSQAQWSLYLANFDFLLLHKLEQSMDKLDALSKQAGHGTGAGDNDNIVLLKPELFAIHALEEIVVQGDKANILRDL
ncbi:hypothetical protein E4T56_gene8535 [Termitomyces sp. T112]|nr:hypothetical protein E4T56_gene8535 [Termitomyces sp. T112]